MTSLVERSLRSLRNLAETSAYSLGSILRPSMTKSFEAWIVGVVNPRYLSIRTGRRAKTDLGHLTRIGIHQLADLAQRRVRRPRGHGQVDQGRLNLSKRSVLAYRLGDVEPGLRVETAFRERPGRTQKAVSIDPSMNEERDGFVDERETGMAHFEVNSTHAATPGANLRKFSLMFCCLAMSALIESKSRRSPASRKPPSIKR